MCYTKMHKKKFGSRASEMYYTIDWLTYAVARNFLCFQLFPAPCWSFQTPVLTRRPLAIWRMLRSRAMMAILTSWPIGDQVSLHAKWIEHGFHNLWIALVSCVWIFSSEKPTFLQITTTFCSVCFCHMLWCCHRRWSWTIHKVCKTKCNTF